MGKFVLRAHGTSGFLWDVIIVLIPVANNTTFAVHTHMNVGSGVIGSENAVVVFGRQPKGRGRPVRSRGSRGEGGHYFCPQGPAGGQAGNDINDRVPESLERKH